MLPAEETKEHLYE